MPNGLTSVPLNFTKLLKPPLAFLRKQGFISSNYLDDFFLLGDTYDECKLNVQETITLLTKLGFYINMGKPVTEPTHVLQHLGFILNSKDMTVQITQEKYNNIRHWANTLLKKNNLKIRDVAKVVGILVSCAPGVQYAPLFYKQLDIEKGLALKQILTVQKWTNEVLSDKKPISHCNADLIIQTDASSLGWSAKREGMEATGGRWAGEDMFQHINYLELKAAFLGIRALCEEISDSHILVRMDNVTAVSYINNMGGTHSLMCNKLAKRHLDLVPFK